MTFHPYHFVGEVLLHPVYTIVFVNFSFGFTIHSPKKNIQFKIYIIFLIANRISLQKVMLNVEKEISKQIG